MPPVTLTAGKFGSADCAVFMVDGYNMLSSNPQQLKYHREQINQETHGLGDASVKNTPTGVGKHMLAQEGAFFDTTGNSSHDAMLAGVNGITPASAVRVVVAAFGKNAKGQPFIGFQGTYQQSYEVLSKVGELTRANAEYVIAGGSEPGCIVHELATDVAAGNTQATSVDNSTQPQQTIVISNISVNNPTVITTGTQLHGLTTGDTVIIASSNSTPTVNGERTVTVVTPTTFTVAVNVTVQGTAGTFTRGLTQNGGAGYLEVESVTLGGYTSATIKLRHSLDDSTYADLITFTNVTGRTAERITVAGTVNRYLASSLALNGAGSGPAFKYMCGFSRT